MGNIHYSYNVHRLAAGWKIVHNGDSYISMENLKAIYSDIYFQSYETLRFLLFLTQEF